MRARWFALGAALGSLAYPGGLVLARLLHHHSILPD